MTGHAPPLVAHLIYALSTGGLENGLVNIINRTPPGRYRHVIICITTADEFAERITAKDVRVIQMRKPPGQSPGFYLRLWRLLRELRPEIIHSRNLAALEAQLAGLGCPGVRRVHGEHGREINDLDGRNWKYLALRRVMRLFIHRYIAVSRDLQQWLLDVVGVAPGSLQQIYNGVDFDRFSPGSVKPLALLPPHWQGLDDMLLAGTVGRLTPVKDQQLLLRAIAELRKTRPDVFRRVRVVLVGDGPLRQALADTVRDLDLGQQVWLAGDRDDVPELLAAMDLFVLPSLAEGISNTVLEAMACGLPVIATAVGGNVELVEEGFNGRLVPVGDARALALALGQLLQDESERRRLGNNARQRVLERFEWGRCVDAYLAVYDGLLQPEARRLGNSARTGKAG
ncbi:MAG: TIGR03088 family PEP-CTERM/XrtA system glycosyltransferase [Halioglobus sp.]